jgi:protein-S-isoprenylcysteine O-methyltransferase Ste14
MKTDNRDHAQVLVHPPVLWVIFIGASVLLQRLLPTPDISAVLRWVGIIIAAIGALPGFLAIWYFYRERTTVHPHGSVRVLLTMGPYRVSRNPIYLTYVGALAGLVLSAGSWWGVILAPAFILAMNRLVISPEEKYLSSKFPEAYAHYRARVHRWL